MPEVWPAIPSCFTFGSFAQGMGDGRAKSSITTGPVPIRRRTSARGSPLQGQIRMTYADLDLLKAFVETTTFGGALPFTFPGQNGGPPLLVRFSDQLPTWRRANAGSVIVDLELEIVSGEPAALVLTPPNITAVTLSEYAPVVGQVILGIVSVTGSPTPGIAYQWQQDTAGDGIFINISGATSSAYTAVSSNIMNALRLVATASNVAGVDTGASPATAPVIGTVVGGGELSACGCYATALDVEATTVPEEWNIIQTLGYQTIGDGGAWTYLRSLTTARGALTDEAGAFWIPDLTRPIPVEIFGAKGGDPTFDDLPGIQEAIDACLDNDGGTLQLTMEQFYYLSDTLEIDPSRISIFGNSARFDFRLKTFADPAAQPELVADPGFDSGGAWTETAASVNVVTISGGTVSAPAVAGATTGLYSEFGMQLDMTAGKTYRIVLDVLDIDTITVGVNTARDVGVSFRPSGVGSGSSGGTLRFAKNTDNEYTEGVGGTWSWDIVSPYTDPYLTIQSNTGFVLDSISVKELPNNTCVLIRTPPDGNLRGHNFHEIRDLKIAGKSGFNLFTDGCVFDTPTSGWSSRINFYNVDISDSIGRCLVFQNRAYLMNFHSCRFVSSVACIDTLEGATDAGENISFFGGNLGGGSIGIRNRGMAIRLYGTSIDFSRQFYVGTGTVEMWSPWLETNQHTEAQSLEATFPETQYRLDLTGGTVKLFGGLIQIDGETTPFCEHMFRVAEGARLSLRDVDAYNWNSTSGALATGEGRFDVWRLQGGSNKEIAGITKRDDDHNLFGAGGRFEDTTIRINCWTSSAASNSIQSSRHTTGYATILSQTGTVVRGTNVVTGLTTGSMLLGMTVAGTGIPTGTTIKSIDSASQVTLTQNVNSNGSVALTFTGSAFASVSFSISAAQFHSGAQSLRLHKTGIGSGTLGQGTIAYKIEPNRAVGGEWWWMVPASGSGTTSVFFTVKFAQLEYADSPSQIPTVIRTLFISDKPKSIDRTVGQPWTREFFDTTRVDLTTEHDGYVPEWATHVIIECSLVSAFNGIEVFFDDLHGNLL